MLEELLVEASIVIKKYDSYDHRLLRLFNKQRSRSTALYNNEESIEIALERYFSKYVAFLGRNIVGAIAFRKKDNEKLGDFLYVSDLGSLKPGVGTSLLLMVEQEAVGMGMPVVLGYTPSSRGFYAKRGYEILSDYAIKYPYEIASDHGYSNTFH